MAAKHLRFRNSASSKHWGEKSLKLLISPVNEQEALEAILGGADIIDVKNPKEGPLGANFPWVISQIKKITPQTAELSCTLGDLPNLPGTAALAAYGAGSLGVNYVKASLYALKTPQEAVCMMLSIVKAVKQCDSNIKVVAAGFADAQRVGSVESKFVPKIASESGCDLAMLDTAVKDGKNLLDFLSARDLKGFVDEVHGYGLKAALAGSLRLENLPVLRALGVDVVGLRGAACVGGDRVSGHITQDKVKTIVQIIKNSESPCRAAGS